MKIIIAIWIAIVATIYIVHGALMEISDYRVEKIKRIDKSIADAKNFGRQLKSLSRVEGKFSETFPDVSEAKDIISLYQALRLEEDGLKSDSLKLRVNRVEDIEMYGSKTGAQRICMSNGRGFSFLSDSIDGAIEGAESVLARPWISASGFRMRLNPGKPDIYSSFTEFCAIFSDNQYLKNIKEMNNG